jgi:hypothetical protein
LSGEDNKSITEYISKTIEGLEKQNYTGDVTIYFLMAQGGVRSGKLILGTPFLNNKKEKKE